APIADAIDRSIKCKSGTRRSRAGERHRTCARREPGGRHEDHRHDHRQGREGRGEKAPKATRLLKKDHEAVRGLFGEVRARDDDDRARRVKKSTSEEGEELVLEAAEEHAIVKTLLSQIRSLAQGDERLDAKMKVLVESVEHHAKEEHDGRPVPLTVARPI